MHSKMSRCVTPYVVFLLQLLLVIVVATEIEVMTEYPVLPHGPTSGQEGLVATTLSPLQPLEPEVDPAVVNSSREGQWSETEALKPEHREETSELELPLVSTTAETSQENEVSQPSLDKQLEKLDKDLDVFLFKTLGELAPKLRVGDPSCGLGVLDPAALDNRNLSPIVGHEVFDVRLRNISLTGLSSYRVQQVESSVRDMRVKVTLHFPSVSGVSDFAANGTLMDVFTVSGNGTCQLTFTDVYARTILYLTQKDGKLQIDSADQPYMDFSSASVRLRDSDKASRKLQQYGVANQLAPLIFWLFAGDLVDKVDVQLSSYLNEALLHFQTPEIVRQLSLRVRTLRVRVPNRPMPYAYISPVYFHPVNGILN